MKVNLAQPNLLMKDSALLGDDMEALLREINDFCASIARQEEIPKVLENYFLYVAKTGNTVFPWQHVRPLFRWKLQSSISTFTEEPLPMEATVFERFDLFRSAPFTIQRLSELITDPKRHYKYKDKFLFALEKAVFVVSTVEPIEVTDIEEIFTPPGKVFPPLEVKEEYWTMEPIETASGEAVPQTQTLQEVTLPDGLVAETTIEEIQTVKLEEVSSEITKIQEVATVEPTEVIDDVEEKGEDWTMEPLESAAHGEAMSPLETASGEAVSQTLQEVTSGLEGLVEGTTIEKIQTAKLEEVSSEITEIQEVTTVEPTEVIDDVEQKDEDWTMEPLESAAHGEAMASMPLEAPTLEKVTENPEIEETITTEVKTEELI